MAKESFLLVSLKGNKAKKLAQVISNKTSRKILDYLAENKKSTESELAKELFIPISTVHYNLKQLVDARLVKADEFHYSEKGKEVNHYTLTNKYIIIAPDSTTPGIRDRIKSILPVGLITLATAGVLQIISKSFSSNFVSKGAQLPDAVLQTGVERMVLEEVAEDIGISAASSILASSSNLSAAAPAAQLPVVQPASMNFVVWFLIGAMFVILLFLFIEWVKSRRQLI